MQIDQSYVSDGKYISIEDDLRRLRGEELTDWFPTPEKTLGPILSRPMNLAPPDSFKRQMQNGKVLSYEAMSQIHIDWKGRVRCRDLVNMLPDSDAINSFSGLDQKLFVILRQPDDQENFYLFINRKGFKEWRYKQHAILPSKYKNWLDLNVLPQLENYMPSLLDESS